MIFSPQAIAARKQKVGASLNTVLRNDDLVLFYSGDPIQKPGGHDQTYPFLPHPDYLWLTGHRRAHGVSAYSKIEGWMDFVLPVTREEKIWEGATESLPGKDVREFESWMKANKKGRVFLMGSSAKGRSYSQVSPEEQVEVEEAVNRVRRVKDEEEIALVSKIAGLAHVGYQELKTFIRPGVSERQIQIEYETAVLKAGAEKFPYDSIVGTGTNGAILHAIPTPRIVKAGELVLIDAGADISDYCVDITRVFPADGKLTEKQKAIYNLVLKAQETSIALCVPGTEWKDVHLASARVMAQGLKDLGILNCSAEDALATGAIGVFFPHGVGHMVGLRVRDVGGRPNPDPKKYGGSRVRVDMPLEKGFMMTVEPGLYFIEALIRDDETRSKFKTEINWSETEKWLDFGGVRLEDDIVVTDSVPRNLTSMVEK